MREIPIPHLSEVPKDYYSFRCPLTIGNIREILQYAATTHESDHEIAAIFSQRLSLSIHRLVIAQLKKERHVYAKLSMNNYTSLKYYNHGYVYKLFIHEMTPEEIADFTNSATFPCD